MRSPLFHAMRSGDIVARCDHQGASEAWPLSGRRRWRWRRIKRGAHCSRNHPLRDTRGAYSGSWSRTKANLHSLANSIVSPNLYMRAQRARRATAKSDEFLNNVVMRRRRRLSGFRGWAVFWMNVNSRRPNPLASESYTKFHQSPRKVFRRIR